MGAQPLGEGGVTPGDVVRLAAAEGGLDVARGAQSEEDGGQGGVCEGEAALQRVIDASRTKAVRVLQ